MNFQFAVTSTTGMGATTAPAGPDHISETNQLLRELLATQQEQLRLMRALPQPVADAQAAWKALLGRWQHEFPDIAATCKQALPALERAYLTLIASLTEQLRSEGIDALENEFTLNEFLDRYGIRLGQLGTVVALVRPLAETIETPDQSSS